MKCDLCVETSWTLTFLSGDKEREHVPWAPEVGRVRRAGWKQPEPEMHLVHVSGGSFPQATASYTCRRRKIKPLEWEDIVERADVSVCSENCAGANKHPISNGHKFERKKINNHSVKADFQHATESCGQTPPHHTLQLHKVSYSLKFSFGGSQQK